MPEKKKMKHNIFERADRGAWLVLNYCLFVVFTSRGAGHSPVLKITNWTTKYTWSFSVRCSTMPREKDLSLEAIGHCKFCAPRRNSIIIAASSTSRPDAAASFSESVRGAVAPAWPHWLESSRAKGTGSAECFLVAMGVQ